MAKKAKKSVSKRVSQHKRLAMGDDAGVRAAQKGRKKNK